MRRVTLVAIALAAACGRSDGRADRAAQRQPPAPAQPDPTPVTAVQIDAGGEQACAVITDGTVRCWGACPVACDPAEMDVGPVHAVPGITDAVEVAVGSDVACVRHADGGVSCWGDNVQGSLGQLEPSQSHRPLRVDVPVAAAQIVLNRSIVSVRGENGAIVAWGGSTSALPSEEQRKRMLPTRIGGIESAIEMFPAAGDRSCARTVEGGIACWAGAEQIVDGVPGWTYSTAITLADPDLRRLGDCGCGLTHDGALQCRPGSEPDARPLACSIDRLERVTAFAIAGEMGCALLDDRRVTCWGDLPPTRAPGPWAVEIPATTVAITAGARAVYALDDAGHVWAWGRPSGDAIIDTPTIVL